MKKVHPFFITENESHYTLIYFQQSQGNKIVVGIILYDGKTSFFKFNKETIKKVKHFCSSMTLFKFAIKGLKGSFKLGNITEGSMDERSKNLNGLIGMSKPTRIHIETNKKNFKKLYKIKVR